MCVTYAMYVMCDCIAYVMCLIYAMYVMYVMYDVRVNGVQFICGVCMHVCIVHYTFASLYVSIPCMCLCHVCMLCMCVCVAY